MAEYNIYKKAKCETITETETKCDPDGNSITVDVTKITCGVNQNLSASVKKFKLQDNKFYRPDKVFNIPTIQSSTSQTSNDVYIADYGQLQKYGNTFMRGYQGTTPAEYNTHDARVDGISADWTRGCLSSYSVGTNSDLLFAGNYVYGFNSHMFVAFNDETGEKLWCLSNADTYDIQNPQLKYNLIRDAKIYDGYIYILRSQTLECYDYNGTKNWTINVNSYHRLIQSDNKIILVSGTTICCINPNTLDADKKIVWTTEVGSNITGFCYDNNKHIVVTLNPSGMLPDHITFNEINIANYRLKAGVYYLDIDTGEIVKFLPACTQIISGTDGSTTTSYLDNAITIIGATTDKGIICRFTKYVNYKTTSNYWVYVGHTVITKISSTYQYVWDTYNTTFSANAQLDPANQKNLYVNPLYSYGVSSVSMSCDSDFFKPLWDLLAQNKLYFYFNDYTGSSYQTKIACLDLSSGAILWKTPYYSSSKYFCILPCGDLFTTSASTTYSRFNRDSGAIIVSRQTGLDIMLATDDYIVLSYKGLFFWALPYDDAKFADTTYTKYPLYFLNGKSYQYQMRINYANKHVYISNIKYNDDYFASLARWTAEDSIKWSTPIVPYLISTPYIQRFSDGHYCVLSDGGFLKINAQTGDTIWSCIVPCFINTQYHNFVINEDDSICFCGEKYAGKTTELYDDGYYPDIIGWISSNGVVTSTVELTKTYIPSPVNITQDSIVTYDFSGGIYVQTYHYEANTTATYTLKKYDNGSLSWSKTIQPLSNFGCIAGLNIQTKNYFIYCSQKIDNVQYYGIIDTSGDFYTNSKSTTNYLSIDWLPYTTHYLFYYAISFRVQHLPCDKYLYYFGLDSENNYKYIRLDLTTGTKQYYTNNTSASVVYQRYIPLYLQNGYYLPFYEVQSSGNPSTFYYYFNGWQTITAYAIIPYIYTDTDNKYYIYSVHIENLKYVIKKWELGDTAGNPKWTYTPIDANKFYDADNWEQNKLVMVTDSYVCFQTYCNVAPNWCFYVLSQDGQFICRTACSEISNYSFTRLPNV
jgi:hypothetical protein